MKGIGVSPGISIGRALWISNHTAALTGVLLADEVAVQAEVHKYKEAVEHSITEVKELIAHTFPGLSDEATAILETHIELLGDPQLESDVLEKIQGEKKNARDAVLEATTRIAQAFKNMDDEYLSARAADVEDIASRLLRNLSESGTEKLFSVGEGLPVIIVAEDLSPSETITMDISRVIGFAIRGGGKTSHAAIIARLRGIPAVVGCGEGLKEIANDDMLVLDGEAGLVFVNPGPEVLQEYMLKKDAYTARAKLLQSLKDLPAKTTDGRSIKLLANISRGEDMDGVFEQGGEGVGLFRTEFLFMERSSFPTEEEQFSYYKDIALRSRGRSVTIRTLDIGGDKPLPYFPLPEEQNPFLGYRAIRIFLDRKDIFLIQLKAILRASSFGKLRILLPMISNVREVRSAKAIVDEAKRELSAKGIAFDKTIPIGIMIEVPSAAITADLLAREVDFFSIGTNDLCQYTLAVDRMNEKIKDLYDPYNPGVLRLISFVIGQAHKNNIQVGLCGELAADPLATLLLAGMGLEEFSMNAPSIPVIKNIIIRHSLEKARAVYSKVTGMDDSAAIINYLQEVNS